MTVRRRFIAFAKVFLGIILDFRKESILIKRKGYEFAQRKMLKKHEKRALELYNTAIELKGALIKLCQLLSTRVDFMPEPYIRILKPLQDNVPPVEFSKIEEVIRSEYNDHASVFHEIDINPIASASLAQIHKAVLMNGENVLLKILKPDIERIIDIDFAIIHYIFIIFSHFKFFREKIRFNIILDDFVIITGDELNFRREAYIASRFKEHFKKFKYIKTPKIFTEYSTQRIIVMEYLGGDKISSRELWLQRNNDPKVIAKRLIEFYFEQIFYTDFIHFDPHPGNILVSDNNEICVVDFGMSGITSEKMRTGLWEALNSFLKKDAAGLLKALDSLGFFRKDFNKYSLLPVFEFVFDEIYDLFDNIRLDRESIQMSMRKIDFKPILDNLILIMHTNSIMLPTNWVYIGKTIGSLFGLISSLDPDLKIFNELKPYVSDFIKSNYSYLLKKYLNIISSNLNALITLPVKIDEFIGKIESGKISIKVDYDEIREKIDNVKVSFIRSAAFFVFLLSAVSSYIFFKFNYRDIFIILLVISFSSLLMSVFYRYKSAKDEIKSRIEKMI